MLSFFIFYPSIAIVLFKELRRVLLLESFSTLWFLLFYPSFSAKCHLKFPPFYFSWVIMLKLLLQGFWPNFALRYAHSTASEISGLFACELEEGIWLHWQHFLSSHRAHAHQFFWTPASDTIAKRQLNSQPTSSCMPKSSHWWVVQEAYSGLSTGGAVTYPHGMPAWEPHAGFALQDLPAFLVTTQLSCR